MWQPSHAAYDDECNWRMHVTEAFDVSRCRPSSSGEAARAGSSSQGRAEGSRQQADASKGRRRLPEPDLDAIDDPQERQRQQRLARIRASAAVARSVCILTSALPEGPVLT